MEETFEIDGVTYVTLRTKEQADELVSDDDIEGALGWFTDKRGVPAEEFMDRLCPGYLPDGRRYEVDNFEDPAAKRILSRARKIKREMDESLD